MAKKLPKGFSVKTYPIEIGLIDMYGWKIFKNGIQCEESFGKYQNAQDARTEGVKKLWKRMDEKAFDTY